MNKIYFVEGLPGTGKTTISEWLTGKIIDGGFNSTCLLEDNTKIPTNFYRIASIPNVIYQRLLTKDVRLSDIATHIGNYYFVCIDNVPSVLKDYITAFDIGNESNDTFTAESYIEQTLLYVKDRIASLVSKDTAIIVDSGLLQNPINEVLFRKGTPEQAYQYVLCIVEILRDFDFTCIYLDRGDANKSIEIAAEYKGNGWYEAVIALDNISVKHFQNRYKIEQRLIESGKFPTITCKVKDDDWKSVKLTILERLNIYEQ